MLVAVWLAGEAALARRQLSQGRRGW